MLLTTATAPAVLAIRVAAPLCWMTLVLPSQKATPPWTFTVNLSAPIFDLASLNRIFCSMAESGRPRGGAFLAVVAGGMVVGLATVAAWLNPAKAAMRAQARKGILIWRVFKVADK